MSIVSILVLSLAALVIGVIPDKRFRDLFILAFSAICLYLLQPALPIRYLDYWLPTFIVLSSILTWIVVTPAPDRNWRENSPAILILVFVFLFFGLSRFFTFPDLFHIPSSPPFEQPLVVLATTAVLLLILSRLKPDGKTVIFLIFFWIALLVVLKTPYLSEKASYSLRLLMGQDPTLASPLDIRWLGISYITFRIIHILRDKQTRRYSQTTLVEFVCYVIFFPAISAGPIDRIERFTKDFRLFKPLDASNLLEGGKRIVSGLFFKFVIADSLSLIALNQTNAEQIHQPGWMAVVLLAYSFRIYFDFSGYTDIAIGMGRWMGFRLPENFNHPYLKTSLVQFWNCWHMTLTQFVRAYFFNPLTRALRSSTKPLPVTLVVLITQVATMVIIGLWHGVTVNFIIWAVWHGLGLFINNRWNDFARRKIAWYTSSGWWAWPLRVTGVLLTFSYVTIGWIWFAVPDFPTAWNVFITLF